MSNKKISNIVLSFLICFTVLFGSLTNAYAASYSVSVNTSSVSSGGTVTVSISGSGCEGSFKVSANNGASVTGNNPIWTGESTTVKAGSGNFTITVSPESVADSNTGAKLTDLGSKSKSITIKTAGGNSGGNSGVGNSVTPTAPDTRSKENALSSLSISTGTLTPEFSADKTSYTVQLTSDIATFVIDAKAKDSKAKVSGTGEKSLIIGSQTFEIVVTAEIGSKKTYTITAEVFEKPTRFASFGKQKLGILTNFSKVEAPEGYQSIEFKIGEETVTGWKNEKTGLTLAYLMDEEGNKNFYIVQEGKISRKYETISILGKNYVMLEIPDDMKEQKGLKQQKIKIGDVEIPGWTFIDKEHSNYSVVYLMNEQGDKTLYSYESIEGTLQKYTPPTQTNDMTLTYVFIGTTVAFAAASGVLAYLYFNFKKKSISAIKDYYDSKNQG